MLTFNCITEKQRHFIQRQHSNYSDNKKKEQSHFIQRQRSKQDKNSELLHQMRSFDETKHSNFVKCLRQTNQKTVAKIIESGGGVMKVEVQYRSAKGTKSSREAQLLLHEIIEDLRSRTKPWSRQTDKLISQLREEGIDILNSDLDRQTVVVWIWCHSKAGLDHIQRMYESNKLRDVLFGLANIPEIDRSKVINIDSNQFKKAVVMRPISINFTQAIDVERDGDAWGITKLRSEIYVLCRPFPFSTGTNVICVFEDRNPFDLKKKIEIKEMKEPVDIGSSEKENCLYVSDREEKCVWKIKRETDDEHKIIKWLTTDYNPWTLSLSSKGQLLVVNDSSYSLMIYGSDAELVRSIQLPKVISGRLFHAVETSIGNFIICYKEQLEEQDEEEEDEKEEEKEKEEEEKEEMEEEEKEEQKKAEEKEGEEDEEREEEKEGDSGSRWRNSINVEKEEEEEATEGEVEEGEEEDMEEKRKVKEDKEWGEEIEGESGSNEKNLIKVETEEDHEEDGGKRETVEEKEKKSGSSERKKKRNSAICELSRDGQMIIRRFIPSNETQQLGHSEYLSLDSDDRVFVADYDNDRVILLDSDLKWNRILYPTKAETDETKIRNPYSLCYDEEKKQLIVGGLCGVNVYTLSRK